MRGERSRMDASVFGRSTRVGASATLRARPSRNAFALNRVLVPSPLKAALATLGFSVQGPRAPQKSMGHAARREPETAELFLLGCHATMDIVRNAKSMSDIVPVLESLFHPVSVSVPRPSSGALFFFLPNKKVFTDRKYFAEVCGARVLHGGGRKDGTEEEEQVEGGGGEEEEKEEGEREDSYAPSGEVLTQTHSSTFMFVDHAFSPDVTSIEEEALRPMPARSSIMTRRRMTRTSTSRFRRATSSARARGEPLPSTSGLDFRGPWLIMPRTGSILNGGVRLKAELDPSEWYHPGYVARLMRRVDEETGEIDSSVLGDSPPVADVAFRAFLIRGTVMVVGQGEAVFIGPKCISVPLCVRENSDVIRLDKDRNVEVKDSKHVRAGFEDALCDPVETIRQQARDELPFHSFSIFACEMMLTAKGSPLFVDFHPLSDRRRVMGDDAFKAEVQSIVALLKVAIGEDSGDALAADI